MNATSSIDLSDEKLEEMIFQRSLSNKQMKTLKIMDSNNLEQEKSKNIDDEETHMFSSTVSSTSVSHTFNDINEFNGLSSMIQIPFSQTNPFISTTKFNTYEKVKMILLTLTGYSILKLLLLFVCLFFFWFFSFIAIIGLSSVKKGDIPCALSPLRRTLYRIPIRIIHRIMLFSAGFYWVPLIDLRKKNMTHPPRVIVANHISAFDGLKLVADFDCTPAVKGELYQIPFLRTIFQAMEAVPIWRMEKNGRQASIEAVKERCLDENRPPLLIFPEGTTHINEALISFSRGAFVAGVPVQPVAIRIHYHHFDNFLGNEKGMLFYIFWTYCQFFNSMTLTYLEEYIPNEEEKKEPIIYGNNVRSKIADYFASDGYGPVDITEHSYADVRLRILAMKNGITSVDNIEMIQLRNFLHIQKDQINDLIIKFKLFDKEKTGKISFEIFCEKLGIDHIKFPRAYDLFSFFDTDNDGMLNFREFVTGICICDKNLSSKDTIRILFHLFSITSTDTNDGNITRKGLELLFKYVLKFSILNLQATLRREANIQTLKLSKKELQASYQELQNTMRFNEDNKTNELQSIVKSFIDILFPLNNTNNEEVNQTISFKDFENKLQMHSDLTHILLKQLFQSQMLIQS